MNDDAYLSTVKGMKGMNDDGMNDDVYLSTVKYSALKEDKGCTIDKFVFVYLFLLF